MGGGGLCSSSLSLAQVFFFFQHKKRFSQIDQERSHILTFRLSRAASLSDLGHVSGSARNRQRTPLHRNRPVYGRKKMKKKEEEEKKEEGEGEGDEEKQCFRCCLCGR